MPELVPKDLKWDSSRFTRILKSAHALYIAKPDAPIHGNFYMPVNKKLSDYVSQPTYKRVVRTIDRQFLTHLLLHIKPAYLGEQIYKQTVYEHGLTGSLRPDEVDEAIYKAHVKVLDLPWHMPKVSFDLWPNQTDAQAEYCLNLFLDAVDTNIPMAPIIANAWAKGDLDTVLADYREDPWVSCIQSQPSYAEEYRQIVDDPISEKIEDLLSGTDTTMMILPISDVLKKDGIFDQLREQGVEITSPPQ